MKGLLCLEVRDYNEESIDFSDFKVNLDFGNWRIILEREEEEIELWVSQEEEGKPFLRIGEIYYTLEIHLGVDEEGIKTLTVNRKFKTLKELREFKQKELPKLLQGELKEAV